MTTAPARASSCAGSGPKSSLSLTQRSWRATKAKRQPQLEGEGVQLAHDGSLKSTLEMGFTEAMMSRARLEPM
jgi:hypothetical protein